MPAYGAIDTGFAGLVVNGEDFIDSLVNADAAAIPFGYPVWTQTNFDNQAFNYSAGYFLRGVAVHTHKEYIAVGAYAVGDVVGVLREGAIQVLVGAAVQSGQNAYWDNTAKAWTNVTTGGTIQSPYRFRTSGASGSIVELDVMKSPVALVG
jgi:hypothetical protein